MLIFANNRDKSMATINYKYYTNNALKGLYDTKNGISADNINTSGSNSSSGLSGMGFSAIRTIGNNIIGRAANQAYSNLDSPYAQQVKDLFDATQDPLARAVKNLTGKSRDSILTAIHNDTPNEDLFQFNITGSNNASLLNNFGYDRHSDEELGIRQNIRKKNFWQAFGDFNNQAGVGATYGAEIGGGLGALGGLALGGIAGAINWANDSANTTAFNNAINQSNMLKRMREQSYQDDYLAQYSNQVNDVSNMNYRNNIRDYYGILRDGGSIHIKPENRGKFTALKERTGHSPTWFKENGTPAQKKMAVFALNARKWNHSKDAGGNLQEPLKNGLTDEQYFKMMERVANENYADWGYNSPEVALLHALNDNTYNYRQFYNDNPTATNNAQTHWPDTYKTVYHPTFSSESVYSGVRDRNFNPEGRIGGVWSGGTFYPNYWQNQYRNGGELNTMDDINNGFIDITEGGTHEQNPFGGIPVNIAEDGLPNLVEEGEMIYNGMVYSNNLRPSEETKKRLGLKGTTYADVIRKAQKYSSERPDDPVAKEYDKYIATTLAVDQEQQKTDKYMRSNKKSGIRGHYADRGAWLHNATMAAPIWGSLGQVVSDWVGNTNQYDYSELDDFRRNAGELQAPVTTGYSDVGQHLRYNPFDTDYMLNRAANQAAATNRMLGYTSPTPAAMQRNIQAANYVNQLAMSNGLLAARQQNNDMRNQVIGANNTLDLQNAGNRLNVNLNNMQAINRYREALADRNLRIAGSLAQLRSEIDNAVSNARNINRDTLLSNLGDWGKESKIYDMIKGDKSLLYAWLSRGADGMGYKGNLRCGGSIRRRK